MDPGALFIVLIKPQFEADKALVQSGGIVSESNTQQFVLPGIRSYLEKEGVEFIDIKPSAVKGTKGNQEYFVVFRLA